jgi:endonuclease/exonuclease/phosphatase family metal-dependent hydrolase
MNTSFAQSIKVMTYNLRLDIASDGVNQWGNRKEKVFALIKKYDPDIFGVQEALHNQMEDVLVNLPQYISVGVGRDDGKTKGEYSAIFYKKEKFDVLVQQTFWLSETPEVPGSKSWDAAITRIVTWARFRDKTSGKAFILANTHFDHIGQTARKMSAELIRSKIPRVAGRLPIIVTGDFNSEPTEPPYLVMTRKEKVMLFDSRAAQETQGTFCTFQVNGPPCRTIDYIFYSKGLRASGYRVITDNDGTYYPSDHLPVISTISF